MNQNENVGRTRYSDEDLAEFKEMIEKKLEEAREQLETLREQLTELNNSGDENRAGTFDDGASNWQREHLNKLASRQQRFIRDLEHALIRIKNKTYGVCVVTGKLIDKQRLMLVPHATKTVEGKSTEGGDAKKTVKKKPAPLEKEQTKKILNKVISTKGVKEDDFDDDFEEDDAFTSEEFYGEE